MAIGKQTKRTGTRSVESLPKAPSLRVRALANSMREKERVKAGTRLLHGGRGEKNQEPQILQRHKKECPPKKGKRTGHFILRGKSAAKGKKERRRPVQHPVEPRPEES